MSAIGAALARALGALGGPATAGALVAGGLIAGALGGGFIAASGAPSQPATATGQLAVYPCPDSGAPLVMVQAGQKLLATGRTEDATWLRIHFPEPGRTEAWVQASPLQVKGAIADLPVAECAPELEVPSPALAAAPSLTATQDNPPTPAPTPPPTPSPTANARPTLTGLTASTGKISYDTGNYCPNATTRVTFRVKASDDDGLVSVTLYWRKPGASGFSQLAMRRVAGSADKGTWEASLDTKANAITAAGNLSYYAIGTDTSGASRRIPNRGSDAITVAVCRNTGPTISNASSSSGSKLSWDPLGVGTCQTATNLTAAVKDVDGVKSVTLFFKRPGSSSWSSKPMDIRTVKGRWYANLDTLGDKISIPNPPTGTLRWYIKAVDDTGKSSQTKTFSITIRRCDTEATFGSSSSYPSPLCASQPIRLYGSASDPDGINGSSAVVVYTYVRTDGSQKTVRKRMTGTRDGPWYYQVQIQSDSGWSTARAPFTWYIETTDQFGGVSKGGAGKATFTAC
jgi:hypothetical protein